jgi:hypothetical protein
MTELRQPRHRSWGPDRLHQGAISLLPPIAQEWRRVSWRRRNLRWKLRNEPTHPRWRQWYEEVEDLTKRQQQLVHPMRKAGFKVFDRSDMRPSESCADARLRLILENREAYERCCTSELEGWEVFSAGTEDL